jgi:multiple sugar transport system permease protein
MEQSSTLESPSDHASRSWPARSMFSGRRWRRIRESLTAYLFLLPAFLIISTFGLFPIAFSVYVSLHRWRILPGKYLGLGNYVKALDNLAYVMGFWLAVILFYIAVRSVMKVRQLAKDHKDNPWPWLLPALVTAGGVFQFVRFGTFFLPEVLAIAEKVKGQERTQALFVGLMKEAWRVPRVQSARLSTILILIGGFVLAYILGRWLKQRGRGNQYYSRLIGLFLMLGIAAAVGWLTFTEVQAAYAEAIEKGESLDIWSQVTTISAGFVLLLAAWKLWDTAAHHGPTTTLGLALRLGVAIVLMTGAWVLIGELPRVIQAGYEEWWEGLQVTIYYSLFTVPFQLGIGLFLATLLFQEIKGKGLFRLIYFLPYITSPVAAAGVFRVIFSSRVTAPMNNLITTLGGKALMWLDGPHGIFQMIVGEAVELPQWLAGPSLALIVIVIYNVWTYAGYDAVVFLAGLGSIPSEYYDAAAIDGAGRAAQFRHITIPLLSPTIYFLTLIAVIGTFKAFTHVWVLRSNAALGTTDTASIVIFNEFNRNTRYGYASALALVLMGFVLVLTFINNRIAEKRVFYG